MTKLAWDKTGEHVYETGVDHGVLYIPTAGVYDQGFAWNGLETVTEAPAGAESTKTYADNILYLNLLSAELWNATIDAYTYPDEFGPCDGTVEPEPGLAIGQQTRHPFGLCYRTLKGNDTEGTDFGYKLHLAYGCLAAPSQKAFGTINDAPSAITFSWAVSSTPVDVPGFKPTSIIVADSTKLDATAMAALQDILYGTVGTDPRLPLPAEVMALFAGTITSVFPTAPTFVSGTHTITIPTVTGVEYKILGEVVTGAIVITADTVVTANPLPGYEFTQPSDDDFFFDFV